MLIYCDTNIFLDYFHSREDNLRPLGGLAYEFFRRGWNCDFNLVISDWLIHELENNLTHQEIEQILADFRKKDKLVEITAVHKDKQAAKEYNHPDDALHAILAKKAGADYLVTRNIRDYTDCQLIEISFPELI